MLSDDQIINVFKALADPNRLQVFELLLHSDRTNSELMEETGLRQNLLSHHLNILNEAGLIQMNQSVGDARRHYYSANLAMIHTFGAWWKLYTPPKAAPFPALKQPRRVLFLCLRNLSRSLIAEALVRHLAPDALIAESAGLKPFHESFPSIAFQVLHENGVPTDDLTLKLVDDLKNTEYDYLITVCDIVHENSIPKALTYKHYVHWSLRDPIEDDDDDSAKQLQAMRDLYDDIHQRIGLLVKLLALEDAQK